MTNNLNIHTNRCKELTEAQKAQHKLLCNAISKAGEISYKEERKAWNLYYNWMKELDLDTVLRTGYDYKCKPYVVTVRDCIPNARINAGWTDEQVQAVLWK